MTFTKDQIAAVMRHVYTFLGAATAFAVAFGFMPKEDADRALEIVQQLGEGLGIVVGALAALLPILSALRAGKSASPEEQIRKVQQDPTNGVEVVSLTAEGEKTLEKIKGEMK